VDGESVTLTLIGDIDGRPFRLSNLVFCLLAFSLPVGCGDLECEGLRGEPRVDILLVGDDMESLARELPEDDLLMKSVIFPCVFLP
jgi:hypothetical protein